MRRKKFMRRRKLLEFLPLLAVLLMGPYFVQSQAKPELDDSARQHAPGQYISLSHGLVHYDLEGPSDAPIAVLVHGLSTPMFVWDHTKEQLLEAGFRVLRYDHYGRGLSDRPMADYDSDFYDQQLVELLDALDIHQPVHMVGMSLGGAVCANFADRYPERVNKLGLIAPMSYEPSDFWAYRLLLSPMLGEYVMTVAGDYLTRLTMGWELGEYEWYDEYIERFMAQADYIGFHESVMSSVRHIDWPELGRVFERVGRQERDVLVVWGDNDGTLPFALSDKVRAAMPRSQFLKVENGSHIPSYGSPHIVGPALVEFLKT